MTSVTTGLFAGQFFMTGYDVWGVSAVLGSVPFPLAQEMHLLNALWQMPRGTLKPLHDIKAFRGVHFHGISVEEVGHDHKIIIGGELISNELSVDCRVANDICEDKDSVIGGLVLGV